MMIAGIHKSSLLDYPGKLCATVFTRGCNLRCPFCHNASLVLEGNNQSDLLKTDVFSFLEKRKGLLDGVCISGGEPLLQEDIKDFIIKIKEMGFLIKLDTNGFFPKTLEVLLKEGWIDYVAMDIKNSLKKYETTVGRGEIDISKVIESGKLLMEGRIPYEFRTTVVNEFHEVEDFSSIGKWLEGANAYFLQNFQDSDQIIKAGLQSQSQEKMYEMQNVLKKHIKRVEIRGI